MLRRCRAGLTADGTAFRWAGLGPAAHAAELNITGVYDYGADAEQVTSISQFADVDPTDWAYQALANLVETYGCVAGYPNGGAAERLLKEFETELAILKGRVDGLDARLVTE